MNPGTKPDPTVHPREAAAAARSWNGLLEPYRRPQLARSLFQLVSTAVLFAAGIGTMLWSLDLSYALTLALAVPTAGLLVRLFIIQHDCGHGSFFSSRRANSAVGSVLGVLILTPFHYWRRTHAIHHATHGDLGRRDLGDVMTLTVDEYRDLSRAGRLGYRLYRNLLVMLVLGPIYQFGIKHRFPFDAPRTWRREWASVAWTNLALVAGLVAAWQTVGLGRFLVVYLPVMVIAGAAGIWLFYVQHQFEDTYWEQSPEWSFHRAGLEGSSFYDLPRVLHWFTGNIGYHHIHHLASQIPNYRLRRCFEENRELHQVTRLTLRESLKCARHKLWDEGRGKLVGFPRRSSAAAPQGAVAAPSEPRALRLRHRSTARQGRERAPARAAGAE